MKRFVIGVLPFILGVAFVRSQGAIEVQIDVAANRHPIDPRIYGVALADAGAIAELRSPLNRLGGNAASRYNWQLNAANRAADWYFESVAASSATSGDDGDRFVSQAKSGGAEPMLTIPTLGWVASVGPNRSSLTSFSIGKYGPQTGGDSQFFPDAGNGISAATGTPIIGNDPTDANVISDAAFQQGWIQHLVARWGNADNGGVRYYALDNEPSIWHVTHRDVHPAGAKMDEVFNDAVAYATQIKATDPTAVVVGPEEWGWSGYFYSGYDQQWAGVHGWSNLPDRTAHGNWDYLPWYLDRLHQREVETGQRLLDVLSVHFYPQGGQNSNDTSIAMQQLRNRSTRALWDPAYVDESWIGTPVELVPRLKTWVATYYPGTKIGITGYNWGADAHINGATAQADVLGIFGREGLDIATRGTAPAASSPTYKAIKMYRNYDNLGNSFGDVSVSAVAPNPDSLAVFAAQRTADGALTIMAINKDQTPSAVNLNVAGFSTGSTAEIWQLTASNAIAHLADQTITASTLAVTLPAQSITLFVVPSASAGASAVAVSTKSTTITTSATTTTTSAATAGGTLVGTASTSTAAANLTAEGGADWIHWGETPVNRKAGVTAQLSNYSVVGTATGPYNNDLRPLSWTDGAPAASSVNNTNGVLVWNIGNGFGFSAPAGTTTRTLTVHVGGYYSGGTLRAHLSDGSALDFVDVAAELGGLYDRNYVLTYQAATAGQQLAVTWTMTSGPGYVSLNGAALTGATTSTSASIVATGGTPQSAAVNTAFATALQATVRNASATPLSGVTVTFTAPGSGATATFGGTATATAVTNASGIATAPPLTATNQTGGYVVTASAPGVASLANFSLTNRSPQPTLMWDPNPETNIAGYKVSYGLQSHVYGTTVDVGNVTSWPLALATGRYYIVVQAYNTAGLLSPQSAEVIYDAP